MTSGTYQEYLFYTESKSVPSMSCAIGCIELEFFGIFARATLARYCAEVPRYVT